MNFHYLFNFELNIKVSKKYDCNICKQNLMILLKTFQKMNINWIRNVTSENYQTKIVNTVKPVKLMLVSEN